RGMALGVTQQLPIDERHTYSRKYLLNNITILMGGRAAEEIVLGIITTGAGNDIDRATSIARKMVCEWGMSDKLGPVTFGKKDEAIFLGKEFGRQQDYSESTAQEIDDEVTSIVNGCYESAKEMLTKNVEVLHRVVQKLLEDEVIDGFLIKQIIEEHNPPDTPSPATGVA
nr:cell division protein FtsH [Deltaproteobacteria bacterium]NIS77903.1 cell division protein FtsH [Deltaproteobacteria bacterium]